MLNIDRDIFNHNLEITKEYCHLQINGKEKDIAKVFRSYNPILNEDPLFSFEDVKLDFDIEPDINHYTLTYWAIDPTEDENFYNELFVKQLDFKKERILNTDFEKNLSGKILISEIDYTVTDRVSEIQSLGLFDVCDNPPIDTWFYMMKVKETRLLFAWIPDEFVHYANEAIQVNCLDCIYWFGEEYSKENSQITTHTKHPLQVVDRFFNKFISFIKK